MSTTTALRPAAPTDVDPAATATGHVLRLPTLPPELVAAARGAINTWLGAGMPDPAREHWTHAERMDHYTYSSHGDRALLDSPALRRCFDHCDHRVREVVGTDAEAMKDTQLALRFPGQSGAPHVDGMLDRDRLADPLVPTAVLGIYLSDVGHGDGALGVWPQLLPEVNRYGRRCVADPDHDLDRRGFAAVVEETASLPPVPVTGPAGSAFLFAGTLPHCNLPNSGPDVRMAIFLRFWGTRHYPRPQGLDPPNGPGAFAVLADPRPLSDPRRIP